MEHHGVRSCVLLRETLALMNLQPNQTRRTWGRRGNKGQKKRCLLFSTDLQAGSNGLLKASEWDKGIQARFAVNGDT